MYKPSIFRSNSCLKNTFSLFSIAMLTVYSFSIFAQTEDIEVDTTQKQIDSILTDFQKTISATSRDQMLDGKAKTSVFIDNVLITQGSLKINADRVEADASKGQGNEVISAVGTPASYEQRLEDGSLVQAQANLIKYDVATKVISLEGAARITQNDSTVSADSISYNMVQEQIVANTNADSQQSVTTVISVGDFEDDDKGNEP